MLVKFLSYCLMVAGCVLLFAVAGAADTNPQIALVNWALCAVLGIAAFIGGLWALSTTDRR